MKSERDPNSKRKTAGLLKSYKGLINEEQENVRQLVLLTGERERD